MRAWFVLSVLAAGCTPEVVDPGPWSWTPSFTDAPVLDLGDVAVGQNARGTITAQNTSGGDLSLLVEPELDNAWLANTPTSAVTVADGDEISWSVTFVPQTAQAYEASVRWSWGDGELEWTLTGQGL